MNQQYFAGTEIGRQVRIVLLQAGHSSVIGLGNTEERLTFLHLVVGGG